MKKFKYMRGQAFIFFLIILTIPHVQPLNAQFSLGVNAGVTRMKFSGDPTTGYGFFVPKPGFAAALRADYRISDAVAISLQPGFSNLKSAYKVMNDSGTAAVDSTIMTLNCFSLPLHAIVWSDNGRFFVLAGIQMDYTLSFKSRVLMTPYSESYEIRDFNLYAQFGAGFIVPLGKPYLSFELRYSQGILDLNSEFFQSDSYLPRTRLTNISFVVGLQLPIGAYSEKYKVKRKTK